MSDTRTPRALAALATLAEPDDVLAFVEDPSLLEYVQEIVAALRHAQDEAHAILSLTVAAEGGRKFPTQAEFARCLSFLADLSGDEQWGFLKEQPQ